MENFENEKAAGSDQTNSAADAVIRGNSNARQTPQDDSAHSQRMRLLARLKDSPVDTITARRKLDVMHPAARILELKKRGYRIDAVWIERSTECGKLHRVALYVLHLGSDDAEIKNWPERLKRLSGQFSHLVPAIIERQETNSVMDFR